MNRLLSGGAGRAIGRLGAPLFLLLLPLGVFVALFHPATLNVANAGWLIQGTDNGENALGAHAYWHDPMARASLRTTLLSAPEGTPTLFTDSNPLIVLIAKPFAGLLPADAQLVGPFILASFFLQTVFAWLLLRRHAPSIVALWAGVALLTFPPALANRFVHANLMAHWTILAALWLFIDDRRGNRQIWWAALLAVAALIHSYLLVMVGAIWASTIVTQLVGDRSARLAVAGRSVAILVLIALIAVWLGVGGQASTGTFGHFSMPLDALWNAGNPAFSNLLPAQERSPGRGFEGFNYLGAGGLVLIASAIGIAFKWSPRPRERAVQHRLRKLVPILIVLTMLAIVRLPLPQVVLAALDPVRASGRLFWPVGYVLVLMALLAVFRLPATQAGMLLVGVIAIQAIDLAGMVTAIRAESWAAEDHRLYALTRDPRWERVIARSRSIAFMPGDVRHELGLFQEISWRAIDAGLPVANVYAARVGRDTTRRLTDEGAAFARGELVPGRLYILLSGARAPAAAIGHTQSLDGVTVIVPPPMH